MGGYAGSQTVFHDDHELHRTGHIHADLKITVRVSFVLLLPLYGCILYNTNLADFFVDVSRGDGAGTLDRGICIASRLPSSK